MNIDNFLFIAACIMIITYILLLFPLCNIRMLLTKKILFMLAFSLAIIGYSVCEPRNWDGYRHLRAIDQIRDSGIGLFEFLFLNKRDVGGTSSSRLLSFNIIRYIIAKYTENSRIIKFIFPFTDYAICFYILRDWAKTHNITKKVLMIIMVFSFTCMPFMHTYSGLRCALASCIEGLAIYLFIGKKKSVWKFAILSGIAVTIHPSIIIGVGIALLSKYFPGRKAVFFIVVVSFSLKSIAIIFYNSPYQYFRVVGSKYLQYSSDEQYVNMMIYVYAVIGIIILFLICEFAEKGFSINKCISVANKSNGEQAIIHFILVYMIYILFNIGNYDLVLRPAYLFASLSPIIVQHFKCLRIWKKNWSCLIWIFGYIPCICMCGYIMLLAIYLHVFRLHYLEVVKYYV